MVERAVYRSDSPTIMDIVFNPFQSPYEEIPENQTKALINPSSLSEKKGEDWLDKPFAEAVDALKICLLKRALKKARYSQRTAAGLLGLSYHQFRGLYRKYNRQVASC